MTFRGHLWKLFHSLIFAVNVANVDYQFETLQLATLKSHSPLQISQCERTLNVCILHATRMEGCPFLIDTIIPGLSPVHKGGPCLHIIHEILPVKSV